MALIDSDDIATLLGVSLTDEESDAIDLYIEFAVGEIEAWLGRPVEIRTFTELVEADSEGNVYLNNTPVHSVSSIAIDGEEQDLSFYQVHTWGLGGADWRGGFSPLYYGTGYYGALEVTYTAGLDSPAAVNSLIASGVIRKFNERKTRFAEEARDSIGVKEIKVEDYSVKYDTESDAVSYASGASPILIFQSESDFAPIKRYKRRAVG